MTSVGRSGIVLCVCRADRWQYDVQGFPSRDMRVSASSGNEVDVEAIVSDLQEKVRLGVCFVRRDVGQVSCCFGGCWKKKTENSFQFSSKRMAQHYDVYPCFSF